MSPSALICPHRPPCTACPRFGEPGIAADVWQKLNALARSQGLSAAPVINGATTGFRHRARLAIRGRRGAPRVGLFEEGTHRVVQVPDCRVHHPLINRVAKVVRQALVDTGLTCYSDQARQGLARYLQVVVERSSGTAQVVLVGNSDDIAPFSACLEVIRSTLGADLHSLWFNCNTSSGNAILGPRFVHCGGAPTVIEHFGGAGVHFPPGAFGQSNLGIADAIVRFIAARVPAGASVAELYAGVGAIGLSMVSQVSRIVFNELNQHSLRGLELGVAALDSEQRARVSIVPGAAESVALRQLGAQGVIADPPRKGLDPRVTEQLRDSPPSRFIYVSCSLDSFLRDAQRLSSAGSLTLTELTAFNLLPFTGHVETVAVFDRSVGGAKVSASDS